MTSLPSLSPPPPLPSPQVCIGDVIVGLDTRPIRGGGDLAAALDERRPGDRVRCDVLRDGKRLSMNVTLGERVLGVAEE